MVRIPAKELLALGIPELRKEARGQGLLLEKLRLAVKMNKEKNTAQFQAAKKRRAQILTTLSSKEKEALSHSLKEMGPKRLQKELKTSKVSARPAGKARKGRSGVSADLSA